MAGARHQKRHQFQKTQLHVESFVTVGAKTHASQFGTSFVLSIVGV